MAYKPSPGLLRGGFISLLSAEGNPLFVALQRSVTAFSPQRAARDSPGASGGAARLCRVLVPVARKLLSDAAGDCKGPGLVGLSLARRWCLGAEVLPEVLQHSWGWNSAVAALSSAARSAALGAYRGMV